MKVYVLTDCNDRIVGIYSTERKAKAAERKLHTKARYTHELGTSIDEWTVDS